MKRILVVDDDAATREAATLILRQELECAVDTVADGGAALERLRYAVPDAVLVSLSIPAMAGGAFMQACQQDPLCGDVPIVVMAVTPRAAFDAIRMGARGCIRKPVDTGGVVAALHHLLSPTETQRADTEDARAPRLITSQITTCYGEPVHRNARGDRRKARRARRATVNKGGGTMTSSTCEQAFTIRHQVIDRLRTAREQGQSLAATQDEVPALLEEVDRLQLVAHAADHIALFPSAAREGPEAVLQGALRFWKA